MKFEQMKHLRAVRVTSGGKLLIDWYREGAADDLYPVGCVFKLCVSMLIGAAIRDGKIRSVDDPVVRYFGEAEWTLLWKKLTIAHALSKTTGLVWPGPGEKLPESIGEMIKLPFSSEPGAEFQYKPDPQIAVCLLEHIYGMPVDALFDEKIGCRLHAPYRWDRNNIEDMQLSVNAMDALGRILLDGGLLDGSRIFNERYSEEILKPRSQGGFPEGLPYGLGCWIGEAKGSRYCLASGFGGQMLAVAPEKEIIVSLISDMDRSHPENRLLVEQMFQ